MRTSLLVVANQTVDAPELLSYLTERAKGGPTKVSLVLPTRWQDRQAARERADQAVAALREAGIDADAVLADDDPVVAVQEAWDPRRYDEVIVSTLPVGSSRWLDCGLPRRVAKMTDATVHHVEVRPVRPAEAPQPVPPRERPPLLVGVLGQLRASTRHEAEG